MTEFRMPKLGADMDQGILLEWKIAPGDNFQKGEIVAVVETGKGAIDIEVFENGVVEELLFEPGAAVPVGTVIAHFQTTGETGSINSTPQMAIESAMSKVKTFVQATANSKRVDGTSANRRTATSGGRKVSPRARRMAEIMQVDVTALQGSGPAGSIVADDVMGANKSENDLDEVGKRGAATPHPSHAIDKRTAMRKTIAAAMTRSKREIPHYYLAHEVDVWELNAFVESWNESHSIADRILPALLYYRAIALAAHEYQSMNGHYLDSPDTRSSFLPSNSINLGIAISLRGGGLVAPCLMDVVNKPAVQLMQELKDLVLRTRKGRMRASELSEGTLTASNLGDRGVDFIAGVIYPPQVALVGIGSSRERPWVVDGKLQVRPVINLGLAADHRVSDGHTGALFLRRIEQLLRAPEQLMKDQS